MKILLLIAVAGLIGKDATVNGETNFDLPFGLEEPAFEIVDHEQSLKRRNIDGVSDEVEEESESAEDSIDRRKRETENNDLEILDRFGLPAESIQNERLIEQQERLRHLPEALAAAASEENRRRHHIRQKEDWASPSGESPEHYETYDHHRNRNNRRHHKSESSTEESREEYFRRQREHKSSRYEESYQENQHKQSYGTSEELNFGVKIEPETDSRSFREEENQETDEYRTTEVPIPAGDSSSYWSGESYDEDNRLPRDDHGDEPSSEESWERRHEQEEDTTLSSPEDNGNVDVIDIGSYNGNDNENTHSSEETQRLQQDEQLIRSSEERQRLEDDLEKSTSSSEESIDRQNDMNNDESVRNEESHSQSSEEKGSDEMNESTVDPYDESKFFRRTSQEISVENHNQNQNTFEDDEYTTDTNNHSSDESEEEKDDEDNDVIKRSSSSSESHENKNEEDVEQGTIIYSSEEEEGKSQDNPLIQKEQEQPEYSSSSYEASSPKPSPRVRYLRYKNNEYVSSSSSSEESREKHNQEFGQIKQESDERSSPESNSREKILRESITYEKTYTGTDNPLPWVYQLQVKATQEFKQSEISK